MGILYVVATPIGNLEDITLRASRILKEVNLIACEDTRVTKKLLDRYNIETPTVSYHQHSKIKKIDYIINQLKRGNNVALVSDAGTPGIDDPGAKLVDEVLVAGINVVPIPGPSALTAAASVAGLPTDKFVFLGFLPKKKGRQTLLRSLKDEKKLIVIYESPYRVLKTLEDFYEQVSSNFQVIICRELTKKFEEIFRGSLEDAIRHYQKNTPRGEFTIIFKRNKH